MLYIVSDPHGELELFVKLLRKIAFGENDKMIICGDVIDKGKAPLALAKLVFSMPNVTCLMGNHEYAFVKFYRSLTERDGVDFDSVLAQLRGYFDSERELLDFDMIDRFDSLPYYYEDDRIICVHAGVALDSDKKIMPLAKTPPEHLVNDRRFKEPGLSHASEKCVFFGHTETSVVCGENRILGYKRNPRAPVRSVNDFYKVHLDTGAWSSGVLGAFCVDNCKVYYVN